MAKTRAQYKEDEGFSTEEDEHKVQTCHDITMESISSGDLDESQELQFPTADELIAGAEQSMEITPEDVTNEAKRGEARSIKIPEVDKSVDGEGMIKFPEVDKTVKGDAKIKVPEVDKTVTGDVRNENDREDLDAEENCVLTEAEAEEDEKSSWLVRFPSGYPPYPTTTPTEQAYWMKVFEDREARLAKEESEEETMSESASQTTTQSKRPAALPKPMGRCTEGNLCDNLLAHSCIFDTDTASAMSMKSADESSVTCYGLSREGEERPTTPPPHQDFRLDDLNLVVGDHLVHNNAPSIIWTNASVLSTLASVLDTEASVIETLPSIISTEASVQFWMRLIQCCSSANVGQKSAHKKRRLPWSTPNNTLHHISALTAGGRAWDSNFIIKTRIPICKVQKPNQF